MNSRSDTPTVQTKEPTALVNTIPPDVLELLGSPPLLSTEDAKFYYAMLASIAQSVRPGDFITWLLIKDLADHRIEIARYRRLKTGLIQEAANKKIQESLSYWRRKATAVAPDLKQKAEQEKQLVAKSNKTPGEIEQLKQDIDNKTEAEIAKQEAEAKSAIEWWRNASSTEADFVELFYRWISQQERIESLLCAAEDRFTAALEELDRHVRGLGRFIRERWHVIEGELVESPTPPPSARPIPLDSTRVSGHHEAARRTIPTGKGIDRPERRRQARRDR
jgi:hypothetical protein